MEQFELNAKVEMITRDEDRIQGTLYDVVDDHFVVSVIPEAGNFKLLHPEDRLELLVYHEKELIGFEGILDFRESGAFHLYKIRRTSDFKRYQRRELVRVPYTGRIWYTYGSKWLSLSEAALDQMSLDQQVPEDFTTANGMDLSGGGVRLKTWEKIPKGQDLVMILSLEEETMVAKGRILHDQVEAGQEKTRYCYGIAFQEMDEKKRESIIKYVFVLMRRTRSL